MGSFNLPRKSPIFTPFPDSKVIIYELIQTFSEANKYNEPFPQYFVIPGKNINKFPINHLVRPPPSSLQTHAMKMQQECSREARNTASTKQTLNCKFVKLTK